jgi:hypothetical protein
MPSTILNSMPKKKLCNSMQTNTKQKRVTEMTKTNPFYCNPMRNIKLQEIKEWHAQIRFDIYVPCNLTFSLQDNYREYIQNGKTNPFCHYAPELLFLKLVPD